MCFILCQDKAFEDKMNACSVKMSGSKPKLKVTTLDEMSKKISSTH
jgi:hypothetical protein